jgi:FkbM family methyltransferase
MATELDYSQSGEQQVLLDWSGSRTGTLLDIGAADGMTFSNSRALIERGWSAVLVEPAPWAVDKLLTLYHDRPDVLVVNALVMGDQQGLVELFYSRDDLVSTTHAPERDRWEKLVNFESCWVVAVELYDLLQRFGPFELALIDAEGETNNLVQAYSEHRYWDTLRCGCFEVDNPKNAWAMCREGWKQLALTTNNVVFVRC